MHFFLVLWIVFNTPNENHDVVKLLGFDKQPPTKEICDTVAVGYRQQLLGEAPDTVKSITVKCVDLGAPLSLTSSPPVVVVPPR